MSFFSGEVKGSGYTVDNGRGKISKDREVFTKQNIKKGGVAILTLLGGSTLLAGCAPGEAETVIMNNPSAETVKGVMVDDAVKVTTVENNGRSGIDEIRVSADYERICKVDGRNYAVAFIKGTVNRGLNNTGQPKNSESKTHTSELIVPTDPAVVYAAFVVGCSETEKQAENITFSNAGTKAVVELMTVYPNDGGKIENTRRFVDGELKGQTAAQPLLYPASNN